MYCRYNETPSPQLCKGKVVLLDTYGRFKLRVMKAAEAGAVAVILALHESAEDEELVRRSCSCVLRSWFCSHHHHLLFSEHPFQRW